MVEKATILRFSLISCFVGVSGAKERSVTDLGSILMTFWPHKTAPKVARKRFGVLGSFLAVPGSGPSADQIPKLPKTRKAP